MKKNIFNDDQTFIEWAHQIKPSEHIPGHIHRKIYKDMRTRLHPKASSVKTAYIQKHLKVIAAASLVLLVGCISMTLNVESGTQSADFCILTTPEEIQSFNEEPPLVNTDTDIQNNTDNIHSQIIDESAFGTDIFYHSVHDITVSQKSSLFDIPELAFGPMDMITIAKNDYSGWELSEGAQIQMNISIDPYYAHADGTGENMVCGYIYNGNYYELEFQHSTEFNFTIKADKSGTYYPVLQNVGVSYIHITSGSVSIK